MFDGMFRISNVIMEDSYVMFGCYSSRPESWSGENFGLMQYDF